MQENKKQDRILLIIILAAMAILCAFVMLCAGGSDDCGLSLAYVDELFDHDRVIDINIIMDETDWQDLLDTATQEAYLPCDVEVNGTLFRQVAIRPKGNTSLSSIAMDPTTDRYSFKLEFAGYIKGQSCFGLDKLVLNNNFADATNMKEAVVYDMMAYLGADASLYNFAKVSVNGEYWGVYLALEGVEESFCLRNYGTQRGEMYKPESMGMGGASGEQDDRVSLLEVFGIETEKTDASGEPAFSGASGEAVGEPTPMPTAEPDPFPPIPDPEHNAVIVTPSPAPAESASGEPSFDFSGELPSSPGGMSGGANLNYAGDDLSGYSTIWNSAQTKTTDNDHRRVVTALRHIHNEDDFADYMDVDNILRYMAAHIFVYNQDSLSGMMSHNYYLYEHDGKLNIIPWDYNLSFGSMGGGNDASSMINFPIDDSWQGTNFFDCLLEDETYRAQYHAYLRQLIDKYVDGGGFDAAYARIRGQIDDLVRDDPTAFFSYDDYDAAAQMLCDTVKLRAESVQGQLDGTIPSTRAGQRQVPDALLDASAIDTSVMGGFMTGGPFGRASNEPDSEAESSAEPEYDNSTDAEPSASGEQENADTVSVEPKAEENIASASGEMRFPFASGEPISAAERYAPARRMLLGSFLGAALIVVGMICFDRWQKKRRYQ